MVSEDLRASMTLLQERIAVIESKVTSAHTRLDKMESLVRDDFKEMKAELKAVTEKIQTVIDFMNRSKGWAAAGIFVISLIAWLIQKALTALFSPR